MVVSEETGKISIANNGKLMRGLSGETLRRALITFYHPDELQGVG
ncbi:MAG: hypothetical protein ACRDGS_10175 [Chloroflexota bacterium]